MSRITIAQLETVETSIQELTATELDATIGGDSGASGGLIGAAVQTLQVGLVNANIDRTLNNNLNGNNVSVLSSGNTGDKSNEYYHY